MANNKGHPEKKKSTAKAEKEKVKMLTPYQEQFVLNLVSGMSQRKAYRGAYNAENMSDRTVDVKASKLFARDDIRARYNNLKSKVIEKAERECIFEAADVLGQIKDMLDTKITDIAEIVTEDVILHDKFGNPLMTDKGTVATETVTRVRVRNTDEMSESTLNSIHEIGYNRYGIYVKQYDKQKTIDQAGKHLKLFTDKVEHSGSITNKYEAMTDEELEKEERRLEAEIAAELEVDDDE